MNEKELILEIANEVCEGCGPERDCGLEYSDCIRYLNALDAIHRYNQSNHPTEKSG